MTVKKFIIIPVTILLVFSMAVLLISCGPQSRKLSRFTGLPVKLKLPKDCYKVVSVSITNDTKNNNQIKNITYIATNGKLYTKEYTDWGILEGSIEWSRNDGTPYMNLQNQ